MAAMKRRMRHLGRLGPIAVVVTCAVFFAAPLIAMGRFAFQTVPMINLGRSTLFKDWNVDGVWAAFGEGEMRDALWLSLRLAAATVALTLVLLVPTTLWVNVRLARARALMEFLTLLPYVIPPIALISGVLPLKPHARWFLNSDLALVPFYSVLALPFTYRSLDAGVRAIDAKTLIDASRSLGASWVATLRRVLLPNLRTAIVSSSFLTAAVVLGEYTMARVLLKPTLPAFMAQYQGREPQGGMALALTVLIGTTAVFGLLSLATRPRRSRYGAGR